MRVTQQALPPTGEEAKHVRTVVSGESIGLGDLGGTSLKQHVNDGKSLAATLYANYLRLY